MTGDPPRRWPDDSPEEDAEAHRAAELARLEQWAREQKLRPLTDAFTEHGLLPGDGEGWTGPLILPDWWDEIPEPHGQCPSCQRPGVVTRFFDGDPSRPVPCPECCQARAEVNPETVPRLESGVDPWAWWAGLTAPARRLHIAATYGTDPWSGRRCTIRIEWTDVDPEGQIRTEQLPYRGCAPDGIYWGAARRA